MNLGETEVLSQMYAARISFLEAIPKNLWKLPLTGFNHVIKKNILAYVPYRVHANKIAGTGEEENLIWSFGGCFCKLCIASVQFPFLIALIMQRRWTF